MRYSAKFVKSVFKVIQMKQLVGRTMVTPPKRRHLTAKQLQQTTIPQKTEWIGGQELVTLFPKMTGNRHIFYLHGGGYALEASPFHAQIQRYFVETYQLKVSYFNYPLAPEHTAKETLALTKEAFQRLAYLYPDDQFTFFGDSAGGGLAMSLAQQARNEGWSKRPKKMTLISPWLDMTLSDPRSQALAVKDVLLAGDLLKQAGKAYAGDWALDDPRVSPIYGGFDELGQLLVISGTDDILYPDVLRLQQSIKHSKGTTLDLVVVPEMMHDFVVYPLKESLQYLDQIGQFIVADV